MISIASAPGKIVLCGEYAVLDGAPAICMAVDRRAKAEVSVTGADWHTVRTTGSCEGEWNFLLGKDGTLAWIENEAPADGLGLLKEAMRPVVAAKGLAVSLDTTAFFDPCSHLKLGLGASSALTAALVHALFAATENDGDAVKQSFAAHRRLQYGRGSGADIATSVNGGLIEYTAGHAGSFRALPWPAGLEYAVLWSGRPANTAEKLRRLDLGPRSARSRDTLRAAAEAAAKTWSGGSRADLLDSLLGYVGALMRFDVDHDLGIFDAGHRELTELAMDRNLIYKPCGAGGGDIGVVFAADRQAVAEFVNAAIGNGFKLLDVCLDGDGVRLISREIT